MDFFHAFMPHGHCYLWTPSILWTHVISDAVIAASYFSIPVALLTIVRKREDLPFSGVFVLFGVFILACGTGHLVNIWTTWSGQYGIEGLVKVVTALASISTAVLIWPLVPKALALPGPRQLAAANDALRAEIESRAITQGALREQARELEEARDAAQAANRAKGEFLANMSHEIRTPLNAVIGLSENLLATELTEYQRDHLRTVLDSGDQLLTVIDDILDFSKIEAGKLELEHVEFNLEDAIGDTLRSFAAHAVRKGIELACQIGADVPRVLIGDPGRLRQVITNLVANAITFTEEGEVVVRVKREPIGPALFVRFSVEDTGVGIESEEIDRLFESFEQADKSTTRRHGGTGLGLSISRGLVQLLGGHLNAISMPGRGSTFYFTARFGTPEAAASPPRPSVPLDGTRVLIVDDNETNRTILTDQVLRQRMQPLLAASARDAIAILEHSLEAREPIRLILCDLHMPEIDGFGLAAWVRERQALDATQIVMLTSGGPATDLQRCAELRIASRLTKPVKEYELVAVIACALGHRVPLRDETPRGVAERRGRSLRILLVEDSVPNQKVAFAILEGTGHSVVVARDGQEGVSVFASQEFDVVLMDVQMPLMDGFECTAAIRATEAETGGHVPIIAMTAHALHGDREKCLAAGMDDYLSKPIRRDDLFAALAKLG